MINFVIDCDTTLQRPFSGPALGFPSLQVENPLHQDGQDKSSVPEDSKVCVCL